MMRQFFARFFKDHTFDDMPNAIISADGTILESNNKFKQYISSEIGIRLKEIFNTKIVDEKVIGFKDGCEWNILSKAIGQKRYQVWTIPEPTNQPYIWATLTMPMLIMDPSGLIKSINPACCKNMPDLKVNDYITKYCPVFNEAMLKHDSNHEVLWGDNICNLKFYQNSPDLWLCCIDGINDLSKIDQELRDANHLKSIGQITSSVVHDFRNVLTVINGYCELALDAHRIQEAQDYIKQILHTVQNASSMVKDLLRFTRVNNGIDVSASPYDMLFGLQSVIHKILGSSINVMIDLCEDNSRVALSNSDLERIAINLIMNAKEAIQDRGSLKIRLFKKYFDKSWYSFNNHLRPGFYLVMSFTDSGMGINKEITHKVITPFFTTKRNGNGLGLSTISSMLRDISGGMNIFSRPGYGTRFDIFMPIVQAGTKLKPNKDSQNDTSKTYSKRSGTIVMIEDNHDVLEICSLVLEKEGYDLRKYSNAEEALIDLQNREKLDLLVTDANLPGMNGAELVRQAKKYCCINNVLVISGYEASLLKDKFPNGTHFMTKPIPISEFRKKVHNLIGGEI